MNLYITASIAGFATGWSPGNSISPKLRDLCKWLGASDDDVKRLIFEALKTEGDNYVAKEREYISRLSAKRFTRIIYANI